MFDSSLHDLSKPKTIRCIELLKCSRGLPVSEIADRLGMSYMGGKQLCQKLEKLGFLVTWRKPRVAAGRPQMVYKLSAKSLDIMPRISNDHLLKIFSSIAYLYGENSAERVLHQYFSFIEEEWKKDIEKGKSIVEKLTCLVDKRSSCGYFSKWHYNGEKGLFMEEYYHPLHSLIEKYPSIIQMELQMMQRLIGAPIKRTELKEGKVLTVIVYSINSL